MADAAKPNKAWLAFWEHLPLRLGAWYAFLSGAAATIWPFLPRDAAGHLTGPMARLVGGSVGFDATVGVGRQGADEAIRAAAARDVGDVVVATTVAVLAAVCLTLPVAWTYMYARRKKGYQQALVQSLLILPVVVTGIVILVQDSLALAFGLGAIVAAVRFRTSIDDSKDASFIFAVMAIGLACGVELAVGAVMSLLFNAVMIGLWYTDFGRVPPNLEGEMAQRRLERALAVANRTGAAPGPSSPGWTRRCSRPSRPSNSRHWPSAPGAAGRSSSARPPRRSGRPAPARPRRPPTPSRCSSSSLATPTRRGPWSRRSSTSISPNGASCASFPTAPTGRSASSTLDASPRAPFPSRSCTTSARAVPRT